MGTNDQLREKLASLLHEQLGTDLKLLLDDIPFVELDYDSLTFAEIRMLIENDLQIPSQPWGGESIPLNLTQLAAAIRAEHS